MSGRPPKRKSSISITASRSKKEPLLESVADLRQKRDPGTIFICGNGDCGQLGLGLDIQEKSRPAPIAELNDIIEVVAGGMHTVCITSDHKIKTFGCNDEGALGRDTSEEGSEAVPGLVELPGRVVQVSAGDSHTSALLDTGEVYLWGTFRDSHGVMGLVSESIEKSPVLLESKVHFTKVVSGGHHLVLLGEDRQVYTCGCAEQGQLGRLSSRQSTRDNRLGLAPHRKASLVAFKGRMEAIDIFAGIHNTFVLDSKGHVYVFGLNNYQQLGVDSSELVFYRPVKSNSFSAVSWRLIKGGEHHTVALDTEGNVYTVGRKDYGRLGLGSDCQDAKVPTKVPIPENAKCKDVTCGGCTSFAITESGALYSWGMASLQLGIGSEDEDKSEPTLVVGKQLQGKQVLQVAAGAQHTALIVQNVKS